MVKTDMLVWESLVPLSFKAKTKFFYTPFFSRKKRLLSRLQKLTLFYRRFCKTKASSQSILQITGTIFSGADNLFLIIIIIKKKVKGLDWSGKKNSEFTVIKQ
jgi:hypothetical protein